MLAPQNASQNGFHPSLQQHRFLIAEDNPADEELVKVMLADAFGNQFSAQCVDRFEEISNALFEDHFDALILDMNLPDSSGVNNVSTLSQRFPDLPIVVLTGNDDNEVAIEALKQGAQDYLCKNQVTADSLARSLRYAKERKNIEQQLKDALDNVEQRNAQLEALVKHDHLTQLPNRSYFQDAAERILHRARRQQQKVALLYFDLNQFKKINDTYGHLVGDNLLQQVSERLSSVVRNTDFLARLSGDEFIVITDMLNNRKEIYSLVDRMLTAFERSFTIEGNRISTHPSIGVSFYPEADTLDNLIKQADCAMYEAKSSRSTSVCFYTEQLASHYERSHRIESEMSRALKLREFDTWYQPIICANDPSYVGVEALIRWQSSALGKVSPDEFICIAEGSPIIDDLTETVIAQCAHFYQNLIKKNTVVHKIAINVSAKQMCSGNFSERLLEWLNHHHLPLQTVTVELTERQVVENAQECRKQIIALRDLGIRVALDDFGSGYSSITHLLDLPLDTLKLDRMLIDKIDSNKRNQALVAGIVEMAHRLSMSVVAEGIERKEEYDLVSQMGCDYLQGYFIARPLFLEDAQAFFTQQH